MNILFLDTETTGLAVEKDEIIEIGLSIYDTEHERIMASYGWVRQTEVQIPQEVTDVHGLTNEMISGWNIDIEMVSRMFESADYYVAHHARFDMSFVQKMLAGHQKLTGLQALSADQWLCSVMLIDWAGKGFKTNKLVYLAAEHGFLNPFPHTALADTMTLAKVAIPHIDEMIEKSRYDWIQVRALNAPRETKDKLKECRYYAKYENGRFLYWFKNMMSAPGVLDAEREFMEQEIYIGAVRPTEGMAVRLGKWHEVPSEF